MKNNRGFTLIDSLLAFFILMTIVSILYLAILKLLYQYSSTSSSYMEIISQWQQKAIH